VIRIRDDAGTRAPAEGVRCALEVPAPLFPAQLQLRLKIRHAVGVTLKGRGVRTDAVELPAKRIGISLKPRGVRSARFLCLPQALVQLGDRILCRSLSELVALCL
jgi:hypothetical protein